MRLTELLVYFGIIALLASLAAGPAAHAIGEIRWTLFKIQWKHNGRINDALNAEYKYWSADAGFEH